MSNPEINIYEALISDEDNKEVSFIITNNGQSSSILELDEHLKEHPWVHEINRYKKNTITVDTFLKNNNIYFNTIDFINIDIQGAELLALKGMKNILKYCNYLYLEVNIKHLYKECALVNEIDDFLKDYGFKRTETLITQHGWGDALYIKS
jgi:FkbM family methyltransferase